MTRTIEPNTEGTWTVINHDTQKEEFTGTWLECSAWIETTL